MTTDHDSLIICHHHGIKIKILKIGALQMQAFWIPLGDMIGTPKIAFMLYCGLSDRQHFVTSSPVRHFLLACDKGLQMTSDARKFLRTTVYFVYNYKRGVSLSARSVFSFLISCSQLASNNTRFRSLTIRRSIAMKFVPSIVSLLLLVAFKNACVAAAPTVTRNGDFVSMAWFANWHTNYTVDNITWAGFNRMAYFGAITSANGEAIITVADNDPSGPATFVAAAQKNNVLSVLSIGGWDGSIYFSSSVATSQNRTTFVNSIVNMVNMYDFQSVEFDWEYPGSKKGLSCNTESSQDTANLLSMLQELKEALPNLSLSAAVPIMPWDDANGNPSTDLTSFAKILDYVEIMNYDVYGDTFSTVVGPNSPLNDTCAPPPHQTGSAVSAVKLWTAAGFRSEQLILGVPTYGHGYSISTSEAVVSGSSLSSFPAFNTSNHIAGDKWDGAGPDACGVNQPPTGDYNLFGLVDTGFLNKDGSVAPNMLSRYDDCSQTPYVYNSETEIMVAYDNAKSFAAKGNFIKENRLAGFALWEMGGDYNNILLNAITSAIAGSS